MTRTTIDIDKQTFPVHIVNTMIVGSGAAGLNAAVCLDERGQNDVIIVTERWGGGASANAGSDKQTYYKLSLSGDVPDSPHQMAEDYVAGLCMHGDIALAEAQHSPQAFYRLVELGVPFPHDTYGGFAGYRTDHDPRGRATSAGPLTSHLMVESLGHEVRARQIPVFDRHQVIALLVDERQKERVVAGAVALDLREPIGDRPHFVLFSAVNVVLATGGPGGLYADSVYPEDQTGSIGLALKAGAIAQNLTESQFGLASTPFRWNVSGSYQQAIPRYVSANADGLEEREFLNDAFPDMRALSTAIFRKGYQWPFDPRRIDGYGSSLIDLLVDRERVERGRRVYLDYTRNPDGGARMGPFSLDALAPDAMEYLRNCGAVGELPIDRLRQMNPPAVDLYLSHGIDLAQSRLEIAVCAQHNNGGLRGSIWWESNVRGLFPIGEVNGSHGVYRPGGAALNAGQVGAIRAAMYIAKRRRAPTPDPEAFRDTCGAQIREVVAVAKRSLEPSRFSRRAARDARRDIQSRMTRHGAHVRTPAAVRQAVDEARALCRALWERPYADGPADLAALFRDSDLALAHLVYLEAIAEYIDRGGESRGSFVIVNPAGALTCPPLGVAWRFSLNAPGAYVDHHILEVSVDDRLEVRKNWVEVRPIPRPDTWFETVWKRYRDDEVVR
jgi:succinate dehydrogenase/fumarate reductase flavoprotein subunit